MHPLFSSWLEALCPPRCWLCGDAARGWSCAAHALPFGLDEPSCPRCARALPEALAGAGPCLDCVRAPPAFTRVHAVGAYTGALREWVLAYKHGSRRQLAEPLATALAGRALEGALGDAASDACLVPVPLHPLRRLERGYDQAALLAEVLARLLGRPLHKALRRTRSTARQGAPGARSRRANVRAAFALRRCARSKLDSRVVLLVDDVVTSGATADECARVLRRAGAREVRVACLARATPAQHGQAPSSPHGRPHLRESSKARGTERDPARPTR